MKISRERLKEIARTLLEILDEEKVKSLEDLENLAGQAIPIEKRKQDYVIISWSSSNLGTKAIDASYVIQHRPGRAGGGAPLDIKINPKLKYSKITLKTVSKISGYTPFSTDVFGNIIQEKILGTINWQEVKEEVRNI